MQIIHCDNHLLIVSKPAGLSTQPHDGHTDNLLDQAKAWVKKEFQKPGKVFLEPIHRLDTPVSGLVLFARTSKALSRLQEMMRNREIEKTYIAWVEGTLPEDEGMLEHHLIHDEHRARVHPEGKISRLRYKKLVEKSGRTRVEIELETGRYHQIRCQFAAISCPIVGDAKYGSTSSWKKGEIALHHGRLKFTHPVTKLEVSFESLIE
jgi:23S rRNA pseudouridine1911/1915/1917 synthase